MVSNLVHQMRGEALTASYNGYTSCPIFVGSCFYSLHLALFTPSFWRRSLSVLFLQQFRCKPADVANPRICDCVAHELIFYLLVCMERMLSETVPFGW